MEHTLTHVCPSLVLSIPSAHILMRVGGGGGIREGGGGKEVQSTHEKKWDKKVSNKKLKRGKKRETEMGRCLLSHICVWCSSKEKGKIRSFFTFVGRPSFFDIDFSRRCKWARV